MIGLRLLGEVPPRAFAGAGRCTQGAQLFLSLRPAPVVRLRGGPFRGQGERRRRVNRPLTARAPLRSYAMARPRVRGHPPVGRRTGQVLPPPSSLFAMTLSVRRMIDLYRGIYR